MYASNEMHLFISGGIPVSRAKRTDVARVLMGLGSSRELANMAFGRLTGWQWDFTLCHVGGQNICGPGRV